MRPLMICSIPRSGSTLVEQILQEVFPSERVCKTHPATTDWRPNGELVLTTIRDPRDVVASLYRVCKEWGYEN